MNNDNRQNDPLDLWQSQSTEAFHLSPDEIHKRIERVTRRARRRNYGGLFVCAFVVIGSIWWLTLFNNLLPRLGALMTMAGVGYMAWQIRSNQLGERAAARGAAEMGNRVSADFYRDQLQRQRDFHRGKTFWLRMAAFVPGPLLFYVGFAQEHPEVASSLRVNASIFIALAIAAVPLNLWMARRYQRQIDELNSFQKEK